MIRTFGAFEVIHDGVDRAAALREHPVQSFLWLYVMMLAVHGERRRPRRRSVAEEMYPGLDPKTQNERMRGRLSQMKRLLPPAVANLVVVESDTIGFDLDASVVDAYQLEATVREIELDAELHSDLLRQAVVRAAERSKGRFLDFWEDLESDVTEGRGATQSLLLELRVRLDRARADLLLALGRNAIWKRDPGRAVAPLDEALQLRPDRDDIATLLIEAYESLGRTAEAQELAESRRR